MNDSDTDSDSGGGGMSIWDLLKEFEQSTSGGLDLTDIVFLRKFNPVLCGILIVIGSLGNIFNLHYFIVTDKVSKFGRRILTAIAVVDFLTVINFPLDLFLKLVWDVSFRSVSHSLCKITGIISSMTLNWSVALLEILAAERFCAVLFPLKVRSICTKKLKLAVLFGFFVVLTTRASLNYKSLKSGQSCLYFAGPVASFNYYFDVAYSWQNSIVLVCTNCMILVALMRRQHGQDSNISQRSRQTVRLMLGLSFISVFFTLPYQIFTLLMETELYYEIPYHVYQRLYDLFQIIYYMNNAVNFVFYLINSADYRMNILKLITAGKYNPDKFKSQNSQKAVSSVVDSKSTK